ncbi:MAG: hypothetical protein DLM57_00530 [Pseudonocardiales bacterium]|nr:MAG: hypothetical protein DLM57_00530 [Pseudonocardiales bacterium]
MSLVASHSRSASVAGRRGFVITGVTQLVAATTLGCGWLVSGIGVAMCTDSGNISYCNQVDRLWLGTGLALALNIAAGITMLATASRARSSRSRRVAGCLCGAGAIVLVVVGLAFFTLASAPIP